MYIYLLMTLCTRLPNQLEGIGGTYFHNAGYVTDND